MKRIEIIRFIIVYSVIVSALFGAFFFGYWQGSIGFNNINYTDSGDVNVDKFLENYAGFYNYNGEYYCVWTQGRHYKDIISTENHEICHHLVDQDYEHFCE